MMNWEKTKRLLFNEDPIFLYSRRGDVKGIKASVSLLNINARDEKGYTPLTHAAMNGHLGAVELLLSLSADIHSRDNNGNSVLMAATFSGHPSVVKLLLKHGADPNACNYKKQTALVFARTFRLRTIEKILLMVS